MPQANTCPECKQGDVIAISMNVSGRDLAFSTCHACEAKWWHRDGEQMRALRRDRDRRRT